jgi:hypothetical protein
MRSFFINPDPNGDDVRIMHFGDNTTGQSHDPCCHPWLDTIFFNMLNSVTFFALHNLMAFALPGEKLGM